MYAFEKEIVTERFLKYYKGICYNIGVGGFGGAIQSEEWRRKHSESLKGKPNCRKGKTHTPEAKRKNAEAHKGKPCKPETREKLRKANKGHIPGNKGVPFTEEQRKKVTEGLKRYWANKKKQLTA